MSGLAKTHDAPTLAGRLDRYSDALAMALAACAAEGVGLDDVDSIDRRAPVVRARRRIACWLVHEQGLSLPAAGRVLRRHHTSVLHLLRTEERRAA